MKLTLNGVETVRQNDPVDPKRYRVITYINHAELKKLSPPDFPWPNPRQKDETSKTGVKVRKSMADAPSIFHLKNQGILILAHSATPCRDGAVVIEIRGAAEGLSNGGSTQRSLSTLTTAAGLVPVEIQCGAADALALAINLARNGGEQMDAYSIANSNKKFEWLKGIFTGLSGVPELKYRAGGQEDRGKVQRVERASVVGAFPSLQGDKARDR